MTDSNRKRAFVNSRIRANAGRTLDAGERLPPDVAVLDPFGKGSDAQTIAVHDGGRKFVRGTIEASFSQFPERGPMAAFDRDPSTGWITNAFLRQGERPYVEVGFERPREVGTIALLPYGDRRGRPVEVRIAGRVHALHRGWNRLRLGLRDVSGLRLEISRSEAPPRGGGPGAFRELRVPGLRVTERLRTPLVASKALQGQPLDRSRLTVLLERTTAFSPLHLSTPAGVLQDRDLRSRADPETRIERQIELPGSRRFVADAWVSAGFETPDACSIASPATAGSCGSTLRPASRGSPRRRASKAFDGRLDTGWVGAWPPGRTPWLQLRTPERRTLRSLRLEPSSSRAWVRSPTRVRVSWPGSVTKPLRVGPKGRVRLHRSVSTRRLRIETLDAVFPAGTPASARRRRAGGIGEVVGAAVPARALPRQRARGALRGRRPDGGGHASAPASGRIDRRPGRGAGAAGTWLRHGEAPLDRARLTTAAGPLRLDSPARRRAEARGREGARSRHARPGDAV